MKSAPVQYSLLTAAAVLGCLVISGESFSPIEPRISLADFRAVSPAPAAGPQLSTPTCTPHVGVASCAAASCHGGPISQGPRGSEYSVWIQFDPHAQAYSSLLNKKSQDMAARLGEAKLGAKTAASSQRCLACHAIQKEEASDDEQYQLLRQDGVSCESCHGGAEKWRAQHTRLEWNAKSPEAKRALGMFETQDLLARAERCTSCHVGSPGRDVDHDLIAAGHPRLNFEYSRYLAKMPPHWDRAKDKLENGNDADSWLIGQVASARAAVRQLALRAAAPQEAAWPEFTEYDCFACHHDLQAPSWRQRTANNSGRPGSYRWGTWYFPLVPALREDPAFANKLPELSELQAVRQLMARPLPDRSAVAEHCRELDGQLTGWAQVLNQRIKEHRSTASESRRLLQQVASEGANHASENWDAAAQVYLAVYALYEGSLEAGRLVPRSVRDQRSQRMGDPKVYDSLGNIQQTLQFPRTADYAYDSPKTYETDSAERINLELKQLLNYLNLGKNEKRVLNQ